MLLTPTTKQHYYLAQVLNTSQEAECPAPDSRGFFTSIVLLWPGSEQKYKTRKGNIAGRLLAVFKYPGCQSEQLANLNKSRRNHIMVVKSTRTSRRRKPNPSVVASILFLSPERRKAETQYRWETALRLYLSSLNHDETNIVDEILAFLHKKPSFIETYLPSNVIPLFQSLSKQKQ